MTPLERAAQAIRDSVVEHDGIAEHIHAEAAAKAARAVLFAIREPSEAMDRAAAECESSYVGDVYTAMIDAALAEEV